MPHGIFVIELLNLLILLESFQPYTRRMLTNFWVERQNRQTHTDSQTDRQTVRQSDRQTDRQTDDSL